MKRTLQPGEDFGAYEAGEYLHVISGQNLRVRRVSGDSNQVDRVSKGATLRGQTFDEYVVENDGDAAQLVEIQSGYGEFTPPADGSQVEVVNLVDMQMLNVPEVGSRSAASCDGIPDVTVTTGATVELSAVDATKKKREVLITVVSGSIRCATNAADGVGAPLAAGDSATFTTWGAINAYGVSDAVVAVVEVNG